MANEFVIQALDAIFSRPLEPLSPFEINLIVKNEDSNVAAERGDGQLPPKEDPQLPEGSRPPTIDERINEIFKDVPQQKNYVMPDISFANKISKKQVFSLFIDKHKEIAGRLIQIFLEAPTEHNFVEIAGRIRDQVNCALLYYTLSVAVQHRQDTGYYSIPAVIEQFPINFIEPSILKDAREEASIHTNPGDRMPVNIARNYTASEREKEQRLAYFREDIGINAHYWHWHVNYPSSGPIEIVNKDRRGELFYYMHQQIMARYNAERFCNSLAKTKPFNNFNEPIPVDYFPKILNYLNNRTYPARSNGITLKDVRRQNNYFDLSELQRWTDRIHLAIDQGFVIEENGFQISLDGARGIDILGNMIESSDLSINRQLYGNLHNAGHNIISCAHDPDERHLEDIGVIGDVTTAMRDPAFYIWHSFIDGLFQKHKATLPSYSDQELGFNDIEVDSVEIKMKDSKNSASNHIETFWKRSEINLAAGLDFANVNNLYGRYVHLQYEPFSYKILIDNKSSAMRMGTCRIFLSPKSDERRLPLEFNEQRLYMIELDKFSVTLYPGKNGIIRDSEDSNVAIPFNVVVRNRAQGLQFCGCGWPQHMLVPRGDEDGMNYDIFVMISDHTGDFVDQTNTNTDTCDETSSYCGLKDKFYPDRRPMGYPFDRYSEANTLDMFSNKYSNMKITEITIQFENKIINDKKL